MAEAKTNNEPAPSTGQSISWQTDEYVHYQRSQDWYWLVGLIAVLGVILSLVFTNFLLAIIIIIAAFSILMLAQRSPEKITITINNRGVKVKNAFFPYSNLEAFAIREEEPARLLLYSNRIIMPKIYLTIEEVSSAEVTKLLEQFLPAGTYEESLTEAVMEKLGF